MRKSSTVSALSDIVAATRRYPLIGMLGWQDVRQRYRRSALGPLWLTISMGVQMLTMGVVVAILFNQSFGKILPYVCIGLIFWTMLIGIVNEGATAFISATRYILHMRAVQVHNRPHVGAIA